MKRRAKGTGTIIKVGNVYYGRISIKGKVKKVKLSTNQREASSLWADWLKENANSLKDDSAKHDVSELWPSIQEILLARSLPPQRIAEHKRHYKRVVEALASSKKRFVEEITKGDIVSIMESQTQGCSYSMKKEYVSVFRNIFKTSCPERIQLAQELKIRKPPTLAREPFTDEELEKLLEKAEQKGVEWKVLFEIGIYTGLRLVDCVHLKTDDIQDGSIMLSPRKTARHGTIVRIPVHPRLKEELDKLGIDSGYFLPSLVARYAKNQLRDELRAIFTRTIGNTCKEVAGRKRKIPVKGFHAFRATFITRLAERGVSLPIMESLAGHINPQQTIHYTHPDEDVKKLAIDVLPDFEKKDDEGKVFVHPEVQKVVDICKKQIEETIQKVMGKKVKVEVSAKDILGGEKWFFEEL